MGEVAHLFICLVHRFPMKEVQEADAVEDKGFKGCIHGRPGSMRQILLMDAETLESFGLAPGAVKENVTARGLNFQSLSAGQRLRLGETLLEITTPCEPCSRMEEIRPGLENELRGQRGWLCRVVEAGKVRRGDRVEVVAAALEAAR
ncbi:MAG: MOSC domain-containing protein [Candidatus Acidiferrales bacterium]